MNVLVILISMALAIGSYVWYGRISQDLAPDSIAGYTYAIVGTGLMLFAAIKYSIDRRFRKRVVGGLNGSLNWHVAFGVMGLTMLCLHSFGQFNPRSGTYALYGMISLAISGFIGRMLDRYVPQRIAREVDKALTAQGDDRIETISRRLQSIVTHNTREEVRTFQTGGEYSIPGIPGLKEMPFVEKSKGLITTPQSQGLEKGAVLQTSWDLAYISLEETPQELSRDNAQYRFVPDRKSSLARPGALMPGAQEHISALQGVQKALQKEQYLRYIIRYWRVIHVALAIITVGLTLWHLEYAFSLLIPVYLPH